ncbi:MAG: hypothetical protein E6K53_16335 [Gammaproteobacteria bacterium]|nr:MAG: hypothetical protein E6K53_16335 [Gammaproteobacteria bacterium]
MTLPIMIAAGQISCGHIFVTGAKTMRKVKAAQASRLRKLVEFEVERVIGQRSMIRCQRSIDSFAIEKTKASTQLFLNVLTEPEIITMLGGRAR